MKISQVDQIEPFDHIEQQENSLEIESRKAIIKMQETVRFILRKVTGRMIDFYA